MNTHADKSQEKKSQSSANETSHKQNGSKSTFQFVDNRPEAVAQRKLQEMTNSSPQVAQLKSIQEMANTSVIQRVGRERSNAITEVPEEIERIRFKAQLEQNGVASQESVSAVKAPGKLDKIKAKLGMGKKKTPKEIAAASARKHESSSSNANTAADWLGNMAKYVPGIDSDKATAAAKGNTAIAHEDSQAAELNRNAKAYKAGGAGMKVVKAAASLAPTDPLTGKLVKTGLGLAGDGLDYMGGKRQAESGERLEELASERDSGNVMGMAMSAEGNYRQKNGDVGKKNAKNSAFKRVVPSVDTGMDDLGLDEDNARLLNTGGKAIASTIAPAATTEEKNAVNAASAEAATVKARLDTGGGITGKSKSNSAATNEQIGQQQNLAKEIAKKPGRMGRLFGKKPKKDKLKKTDHDLW